MRARRGVRRREHRVDRGAHPIRQNFGARSVELAVEVQEIQAVDETPDRGRHRILGANHRVALPICPVRQFRDGRLRCQREDDGLQGVGFRCIVWLIT